MQPLTFGPTPTCIGIDKSNIVVPQTTYKSISLLWKFSTQLPTPSLFARDWVPEGIKVYKRKKYKGLVGNVEKLAAKVSSGANVA